jgi:2-methylcitrate dehydratase
MTANPTNVRPAPDQVIADIAAYVDRYQVRSALAFETAHYCLIDSLGCGFEALAYPACTKLLGPIVPGTMVSRGCSPRSSGARSRKCAWTANASRRCRSMSFSICWCEAVNPAC